jgi:hypothetical protein
MALIAVNHNPFALSDSDRDLIVRTALGEAGESEGELAEVGT